MCIRFHQGRRNRQSGQALLEYILILSIILTIAGGVLYQYNSSFRAYARALFVGEESYLACLIREGVLPGVENAVCDDFKPQYNFANGKPLRFQTSPLSGVPPANPAGNQAGGGANSAAAQAAAGAGRAGEVPGGVPFSSRDGIGFKTATKTAAAAGQGRGRRGADPYTGSNEFSSQAGGEQVQGGSGDGRGRSVPIRSTSEEDLGREKAGAKVPLNERDLKTGREIAAEKARKKGIADEESGFSIGNFLKYLIIIALAFSIIFFVGSQFVSISRGSRRQR
jgi:hypothetical protein